MLKVWWSSDFIWTCYGYMKKVLLLLHADKQTNKQTHLNFTMHMTKWRLSAHTSRAKDRWWASGPQLQVTKWHLCTHTRACKRSIHPPKHYKSTQDTLLSNFHFLHYTQILHCLKDQWWLFGQHPCCMWPNSVRLRTQAHAKDWWWVFSPQLHMAKRHPCTHASTCKRSFHNPKHYKSTPGTLLSNFHFLHYTQILHC